MKKLIALASRIRLDAVLCGAAAILLSACGAGASDPVKGLQSQSAAELTTSTVQPAANDAAATPYGDGTTPAVPDATIPATPAAAPAARAATPATRAGAPVTLAAAANIEPAYDGKRQSASTTGFSDQSDAPVEVAQETAPAACDNGACQH